MMMRSLWFLCLTLAISGTSGFVPMANSRTRGTSTSLSMALIVTPPPPMVVNHQQAASPLVTTTTSKLQQGIDNYLSSSSHTLALEERRPPTQEEIEAKKRNFNVIFWGGGFVAPFLATIFYFGFKFWEK